MTLSQRSRRWALALVPAALLLALLGWGAGSPPGSSPDDDYHMASIWCANGPVDGRCEVTGQSTMRRLPAELVDAAKCFAFLPEQSASCPLPPTKMISTKRGNWNDAGYPPVFYATMGLFVTPNLSTSIIMMRSANALLFVGLMTGLFALLRRPMRGPMVWGSLVSAIPLGMFLIPSVNPSSWAVISATGLWVATWGYFRETGPRKWGLATMMVVLMVMGAGARSDAAVYGVIAMLAGAVLAFRADRRFFTNTLVPLALTVLGAVFFFTSGQSSVVSSDTSAPSTVDPLLLTLINAKMLPQLWTGVFGLSGLGWLDTIMPGVVWVPALVVFAAIAFWGLQRGDGRKWIALAGVSTSLVIIPMYILVHDGVVVGTGVQPRYIYPLLIMLAGVAVTGFASPSLRLGRLQLVAVGISLAVANAVALYTNMRRYITGVDAQSFDLNRAVEWWWNSPIQPMTLWVTASLAFAAALVVGVFIAWPRRGDRLNTGETLAHSSLS